MNNKKIKVAMVTNHFGITGIGTVIMNYCKALDKEKYDLTILAGQPISEKYEKECLENERTPWRKKRLQAKIPSIPVRV